METVVHDFKFFGAETPSETADNGFWRKADTSVAGSPTMIGTADGMKLLLVNTNEVQNLCLYFGDVLPFDIDNLKSVEIWAQCAASLAVGVDVAFGVTSARNDTIDTIGEQALFRVIGAAAAAGAVTLETDDATNNNDDKATGETLAASIKRFRIDFDTGVYTNSPPDGAGVGGKADVRFSMDNGSGLLTPVGTAQRFDMSNYSSGLQLFAQIQKTSGTEVGDLTIKRFRVTEQFPF